MPILSRREARRLGRLGGQESAADRKRDSAWGRAMARKVGGRARAKHYPDLVKLWAQNAARARWGLPLVPVPLVMTPRAIAMREWRQLERRRREYERDQANAARALAGSLRGERTDRAERAELSRKRAIVKRARRELAPGGSA